MSKQEFVKDSCAINKNKNNISGGVVFITVMIFLITMNISASMGN